jgi:hypothetical protein
MNGIFWRDRAMSWGSKLKKNILPLLRLCILLAVAVLLPRLFLKKPSSNSDKKMLLVAQSQERKKEKNWRTQGRLLAELQQFS